MKIVRTLFIVCAAAFLLETGGASSVYGQKIIAPELDVKQISSSAQPKNTTIIAPTVTRIDFEGLKAILKSNANAKRPLLVNFWATWCPPCREEFPELVKIDQEYRPQGLEFVTVSLDYLSEIEGDVPAFLKEMKANMPAYLLKTDDEEKAIHSIAPDWRGALPLTVLYDTNGKPIFTKMGAVKPEILRKQIEKVISIKP